MLISFKELIEKYNIRLNGILHVGAHHCEEIDIYEKYIPRDKILWIEALKGKVDHCKNIHPGVLIEHVCISDIVENVKFNIANNGMSSSFLELGIHLIYHPDIFYFHSFKIETQILKNIISKTLYNNIPFNFIKLAIQGTELKALKGMGKYIEKIDHVYIKVNSEEVYKECALISEVDEYLSGYGLMRVETNFTMWKWGDAFYTKRVIIFEYNFPMGGIADFIKFFICTLELMERYKTLIYINILHPIRNYMNIKSKYLLNEKDNFQPIDLSKFKNMKFDDIISSNRVIKIKPTDYHYYNINFDLSHGVNDPPNKKYNLDEYFSFNADLYPKINEKYECIHIRMGDKFLEVKASYYQGNDTRNFKFDDSIKKIELILEKDNGNFFIIADNNEIKRKIQTIFPSINVFSYVDIVNISEIYPADSNFNLAMENVIKEFLFMVGATKIHALTYSGFSIVSSYIGGNELIKYY